MRDFIVGIIFFLAMGLLLIVTAVTRNLNVGPEPRYLTVDFTNVSGLRSGNKVRISGLDVGIVEKLELTDKGTVRGVLRVTPSVKLREGKKNPDTGDMDGRYEIIVRDLSLLGGKFVDIVQGDELTPELPLDAALVGAPAPEFLRDLSEVVDENRSSLRNILSNLEAVSEKMRNGNGLLQNLMNDQGWSGKFGDIVDNVNELTEALNEITQDLRDGKGTLGKILREDELYTDVRSLTGKLDKIADKVNEGQGVVARLLNDGQLADTLDATVKDIRAVAADIRNGPGAVTMLIKDQGFRDDLTAVAKGAREIVDKANNGQGTIAMFLNDQSLSDNARETVAQVRAIVDDIRQAEGPLGMLIEDREARDKLRDTFDEAQRAITELRESIEDTREQAPISAFTGILFSAF